MNPRLVVTGYLIAQAASVAAWWLLLAAVPASTSWFQPKPWPALVLSSFCLADFLLLVGGSLLAADAVWRRRPWAAMAVWTVGVVAWYPALYCLGVSFTTGEAWLATAMMTGMAGCAVAMATIHGVPGSSPAPFRAARLPQRAAVGWTLFQTVLFWGILLGIVPQAIVEVEGRWGWPAFSHPFQTPLALTAFTIASLLGISSGLTMAVQGLGTPLPTATAPRLVLAGPYRWVRNPMAVAGIGQGLAVGWLLGSGTVVVYALAGAVLWQWLVRPAEEADLQRRFGQAYADYQQSVGLWIPRFRTLPTPESRRQARRLH